MAVRKKRTTKRRVAKKRPAAKKVAAKRKTPSWKKHDNVVNFNKYMDQKKKLKMLRDKISNEFKSDQHEIQQLTKYLKAGHKKAA
jgi:hypothetical protein